MTKSPRDGHILDIIIMNVSSLYETPVIVSVLVCYPHIDRFNPAVCEYKTIIYCQIPDSAVEKFGKWLLAKDWSSLSPESSPTEQVIKGSP